MKTVALSFISMALLMCNSISQADTTSKWVYSGKFGDGKATLFIDSMKNGKVSGSSLYKHNRRPITGTIRTQGNFWQITLNEPGTRTGDGQFDITTNKDNPEVLIGKWTVFPSSDTRSGISSKSFNLRKTRCDYDIYGGTFKDTSTRVLTTDELYLDPDSLDYMRNEIFARHGYSFKTAEWASAFASQDWYVPCYTDVTQKLSYVEEQNINNIKKMHKYMTDNPDQWGR